MPSPRVHRSPIRNTYADTLGLSAAQTRIFTARRPTIYAVSYSRPWTWVVDTCFLPSGGKNVPVLAFQEATTRLLFARRLPGTAPTAAAVEAAIRDLVATHRVEWLSHDGGSEFVNRAVQRLLRDKGIGDYTTAPGDLSSGLKVKAERAVQILRHALEVYTHTVRRAWDNATLEAVCDWYNEEPNSATGVAPSRMTAQQAEIVRARAFAASLPYYRLLASYLSPPRQRVHVWLGMDPEKAPSARAEWSRYRKGRAKWTTRTWRVAGRVGLKLALEGVDGTFSPRDVLRATGDVADEAEERAVRMARGVERERVAARAARFRRREGVSDENIEPRRGKRLAF